MLALPLHLGGKPDCSTEAISFWAYLHPDVTKGYQNLSEVLANCRRAASFTLHSSLSSMQYAQQIEHLTNTLEQHLPKMTVFSSSHYGQMIFIFNQANDYSS